MKNINFRQFNKGRKKFAGFTLVETMVAVFIFILISGLTFLFIFFIYRYYKTNWQQSVAIEEARRGVETMVKEIRMASPSQDGSYPIEKAEDKEFVFYSDIDGDGDIERVRYFLGTVNSGSQTKECETFIKGGACDVDFSDFLNGTIISSQVKVSVDGDFGWNNIEYADVYVNGYYNAGRICRIGCLDCLGSWQGTQSFNVTGFSGDDNISFTIDSSNSVDPNECALYSMKAIFEFSWTEDLGQFAHEFKKGVIKPVVNANGRIEYPPDQEEIIILTSFLRNVPPIFKYFDQNGQEITESPARLKDTKVMEVYLIVNVNPSQSPNDFELRSAVQLRNLKEEY